MNAPRIVNWANVSLPPVGPVKSIPDIVKALQENMAKLKLAKGAWVMGYGYDATGLAEKREMTRDDLDPFFPDNPVMAIHVSNHGAVLNSLALKTFNITADTPTPAGGLIAREPGSNQPAGLLMETAFMPIFAKVPQPGEDEMLDLLKPAQQIYASKGVTTAQEGATHADELSFLRKAGARGPPHPRHRLAALHRRGAQDFRGLHQHRQRWQAGRDRRSLGRVRQLQEPRQARRHKACHRRLAPGQDRLLDASRS